MKAEKLHEVKVHFTLKQATKVQSGIQVQLYSFFNHGFRWGCVVNATTRPLFPHKWAGTHFKGGWWAPGPVFMDDKISPPPGFHPRTVQPRVSRNTEYAIPAHIT